MLLTDLEAGPTAATDFFSILKLSGPQPIFGCCHFCEIWDLEATSFFCWIIFCLDRVVDRLAESFFCDPALDILFTAIIFIRGA